MRQNSMWVCLREFEIQYVHITSLLTLSPVDYNPAKPKAIIHNDVQ